MTTCLMVRAEVDLSVNALSTIGMKTTIFPAP